MLDGQEVLALFYGMSEEAQRNTVAMMRATPAHRQPALSVVPGTVGLGVGDLLSEVGQVGYLPPALIGRGAKVAK